MREEKELFEEKAAKDDPLVHLRRYFDDRKNKLAAGTRQVSQSVQKKSYSKGLEYLRKVKDRNLDESSKNATLKLKSEDSIFEQVNREDCEKSATMVPLGLSVQEETRNLS